jgi:hypothetical protein
VNFRGLISFGVERYADALLQKPAAKQRAGAG